LTRELRASLYAGSRFDKSIAVLVPRDKAHLPAIWAYCSDGSFSAEVRKLDQNIIVANGTLVKVPFDLEHWSEVAARMYPTGLPEPSSDDPTQWLFSGDIAAAEIPLQVAVAKLLGYRWPDQAPGPLDRLADGDGIVCLQPIAGERPAGDRLREILSAAFGADWSESYLTGLLQQQGATNLDTWLRDSYFSTHCRLFQNRPFIWHVWDRRQDGFSALLNYHTLDKATLEKLTYSTLQWWIDRQRAEAGSGVNGADSRLAAAIELQGRLAKIIEGEPPFDIYVRWKPLPEQPIGWDPDLDGGVRLNIRPFVNAGVLRSKFTINWNKDRGKNPDGSERFNDLHFTIAEKLAARGGR